MPLGRPKSPLDLPEGWEEEILALYANGASDVEVRALIWEWRGTLSDDLWYRWLEEEPTFSRTVKMGHELSQVWWEKEGRLSLRDKDFNHGLWYMNMKNRFKWADRQNNDITSGGKPIPILGGITSPTTNDDERA